MKIISIKINKDNLTKDWKQQEVILKTRNFLGFRKEFNAIATDDWFVPEDNYNPVYRYLNETTLKELPKHISIKISEYLSQNKIITLTKT